MSSVIIGSCLNRTETDIVVLNRRHIKSLHKQCDPQSILNYLSHVSGGRCLKIIRPICIINYPYYLEVFSN